MNEKSFLKTDNNLSNNGGNIFNLKAFFKRVVLILSLLFFVYSLVIYLYASNNLVFAERYVATISASLREVLATLSSVVPFSVAESVVIIGIPAVAILIIRALVLCFRYKNKNVFASFLLWGVCVMLVASAVFLNAFGICYKRVPVSDQLRVDTDNVTSDDIYVTAYIISESLSELCGEVSRISSGASVMPYGFDEMVDKICNGYSKVLLYVPEKVSVKQVSVSEIWAYTHISGMYFPFTGESNINTSFPDYIIAYTTAHELAHQFGFAGEDDANMLAFLACINSEDKYLAYSSLLSAFEYLISDMPSYMAKQLSYTVDGRIKEELSAYSKFMKEHTNRAVTEISSKVNDVYLKSNGVEQGTASYRNVSKLITAFFKQSYPQYFKN